MEYQYKLQSLYERVEVLNDLDKEELIDFIKLIIRMSMKREEANKLADQLMVYINDSLMKENEMSFDCMHEFELVTGYRFNLDLVNKLTEGSLKIIREEDSTMNELIKQVENWSIKLGLDKAESSKQFLKVTEEVGEND